MRRRTQINLSPRAQGSVFVEFGSKEDAQKFIDARPSFGDTPLEKVMFMCALRARRPGAAAALMHHRVTHDAGRSIWRARRRAMPRCWLATVLCPQRAAYAAVPRRQAQPQKEERSMVEGLLLRVTGLKDSSRESLKVGELGGCPNARRSPAAAGQVWRVR